MTAVVDTNAILRFLVGDDAAQQGQATAWFKEAEQGQRTLIVHPLVVAECCFVLESFYGKSRGDIAHAMEVFLSQRWLKVLDREVLIGLWSGYRKGLHFVDSFLLSMAERDQLEVLTYDKKVHQRNETRD